MLLRKRKRFAAIVLIILAGALLVLAGPFKFKLQKKVTVHASLYDISKQFTDLRNWPGWYPAFRQIPSSALRFTDNSNKINSSIKWDDKHSIIVIAINPALIVIKETIDDNIIFHSIEGFPTDYGNNTIISWTKKTTAWKWLQEKLFSSGEMSTGLNMLKKSCEDPVSEYGFDINIERVPDTVIVTKEINARKTEKLMRQHLLVDTLKSFLASQHIPIQKSYIYTSTILTDNKDRIIIAVGIPVAKKGSNSKDIKFLELPATGRLLIGRYTGVYGQINRLYEAMDTYVKNKGIRKAAQPMEQHNNFIALTNDSIPVTVRLIYPVY